MGLNTDSITEALVSHALRTGHFDSVNRHEPGAVPNHGVHCAIWADRVSPVRGASGLNNTTARIVFNVRVYTSTGLDLSSINAAEVEPEVLKAVDALMTSYCGDFDLGTARNIDIFGSFGASLDAQAGYLQMEGAVYRIMTLLVPVIVNDAWEQVA